MPIIIPVPVMVRFETVGGRGGERASDAEIGKEGVPIGDEHVVRFDIAMDHAHGVRVQERRLRQLAQDSDDFPDRQPARAPEPRAKRLAGDERHHAAGHGIRQSPSRAAGGCADAGAGRRTDLGEEPVDAERGCEVGCSTLMATSRSCLRSRAR